MCGHGSGASRHVCVPMCAVMVQVHRVMCMCVGKSVILGDGGICVLDNAPE